MLVLGYKDNTHVRQSFLKYEIYVSIYIYEVDEENGMGFSPWTQRVFIMKMSCGIYLCVCKHSNTKKRENRKSQGVEMLSDTCLKGTSLPSKKHLEESSACLKTHVS